MNVVPSLEELLERRFSFPDFDLTTLTPFAIIQSTQTAPNRIQARAATRPPVTSRKTMRES